MFPYQSVTIARNAHYSSILTQNGLLARLRSLTHGVFGLGDAVEIPVGAISRHDSGSRRVLNQVEAIHSWLKFSIPAQRDQESSD